MSNLIGQSIGHYHILEQLGEGGMATVYKALDTHLQRYVAVKVIRTDIFGSTILERLLKRFKSEGLTLAKLTHPNIVPILDYGDFNGAPYLIMPYLPGGTLKSRMTGKIRYWEAARLLIPIAKALFHAHQQGIIHRDIKPSNILITSSGEPMLSDFGIAKILASEETRDQTNTGTGVGTPEYMAPEQALGQVDERVDIYALGIVLYEMITGRIPFRADTPMAVLLKKSQEPLPRPKRFVPDLPDWVESMMIKALAREPQNRYQSMSEFLSGLEKMARDEETVPDVKRSRLLLPPIWKNITIIIFICLFLTGLAAGGYAYLNYGSKDGLSNSITSLPDNINLTLPVETISFTANAPTTAPTITPVTESSWQQGRLVFVMRNASKVFFLYELDLTQDGQPQILLTPENPKSRYYAPQFSTDGTKLAFYDFYFGKMFVWDLDLPGNPSFVSKCAAPSFSPDGTMVICHTDGSSYFPVYDSNNGSLVNKIHHNMSGAMTPAWSPDGTEIAFSILEGDGKTSIWKMNVEEGNPIPLAIQGYENYLPSWSPDGEWIAYQSTLTSEKSEIWIIRKDGTEQKQITDSGSSSVWSRGPDFSPDGQWLAFVSSQNGETDGPDFGDVFVVSLLTGEVHQVTNTGGYVWDWRVTWGK